MGSATSKPNVNRKDQNCPLPRSLPLPVSCTSKEAGGLEKIGRGSSKLDLEVSGNIDSVSSRHEEVDFQARRSSSRFKPAQEDITIGVREDPRLPSVNAYNIYEMRGSCGLSAPSSLAKTVSNEANLLLTGNGLRSIEMSRPENAFNGAYRHGTSFQCMEDGLRLLLSPPVVILPRIITASGRFRDCSQRPSWLNWSTDDSINGSEALDPPRVHVKENLPPSVIEGMGDPEDQPGSPLFDPLILETFERAIEALSDDSWESSGMSSTTSSRVACSSLDECSDADSLNWPQETVVSPDSSESLLCMSGIEEGKPCQMDEDTHRQIGRAQRRINKSRFACSRRKNLEDFELKCVPSAENKIVLYFTSLRGIRATYENCCLVRCILKGRGVQVDERDVWMHSKFREELANALGEVLPVPRLFIKGRYIGGAEDVKRLHEEGTLESLLEGLPAECDNRCDVCGDVRFVPCRSCCGSCKVISDDEVLRCPVCNENGLVLCPSCGL